MKRRTKILWISVVACLLLGTVATFLLRFKADSKSTSPLGSSSSTGVKDQFSAEIQSIVDSPDFQAAKRRSEAGEPFTAKDVALIVKINTLKGKQVEEPVLFKSKKDPPSTPEEKAMWEWWSKMQKLNPNFRYERPISFYGKVVDSGGNPIPDASVSIEVKAGWDKEIVWLTSDARGLFELTGKTGKNISVYVSKDGYLSGGRSRGEYEYADFFTDSFYTPIKEDPVVFSLRPRS